MVKVQEHGRDGDDPDIPDGMAEERLHDGKAEQEMEDRIHAIPSSIIRYIRLFIAAVQNPYILIAPTPKK